jgi:hypothetical protein
MTRLPFPTDGLAQPQLLRRTFLTILMNGYSISLNIVQCSDKAAAI